MQSPGNLPLEDDRFSPFERWLAFVGMDFTGATFKAQVRARKDGGALYATLNTVTTPTTEGIRLLYAGTDTITNHIAAGRLEEAPPGYEASDAVALSWVYMRINEATMEAMPYGTERGDDADFLWWDMLITPSGGSKDQWLYGAFKVRAGATE